MTPTTPVYVPEPVATPRAPLFQYNTALPTPATFSTLRREVGRDGRPIRLVFTRTSVNCLQDPALVHWVTEAERAKLESTGVFSVGGVPATICDSDENALWCANQDGYIVKAEGIAS